MKILTFWALVFTSMTVACLEPGDGDERVVEGEVVTVLGTESGPTMLGGRPLHAASDSAGGYVMVDGVTAVRVANSGQVGVLGRRGEGPGEYTRPTMVEVDASGTIWIFDLGQGRAVGFDPEGVAVASISLVSSPNSMGSTALPDGDLVTLSPGMGEHEGFLLHRYDSESGSWQSSLEQGPETRQNRFAPPTWIRVIEGLDDGRVLSVHPSTYEAEIIEISTGEVRGRWVGADEYWRSLIQREGEEEFPPSVVDILWNGDGTCWILLTYYVDVGDWIAKRDSILDMSAAERREGLAAFDMEPYENSLLELRDVRTGEVLKRIRTDRSATMLLGSGPKIGHYPGDLPFPRLEVITLANGP